MLKDLGDWIKNLVNEVATAFSDFHDWIWNILKSIWQAIESVIRQTFSQLLLLITEVVTALANAIGGAGSSFLGKLGIGNFLLLAGTAIFGAKIILGGKLK